MTKKFDLGRLALGAGALVFAVGCGAGNANDANEESVGSAQQALTAAQTRVLGFETPASDWSSTRAISSSATASQGSAALAITPNGYVEVNSIALSSLGAVKSQVGFDLRLPQTLAWGEARLVVSIPSKGINWQDLGGISLVGQAANSYKKLTFAVPAALETALEGTYTDLRLRVVLNAPNTAAPFLVDNFDIADTGSTPAPAPPNTLSFVYPRGQALSNVFMSASDRLQVDDRVALPQPGKLPVVAGLGSSGVEVGALGHVIGNLYSGGNVFLRSTSHAYGFITAAGTVTKQQADVLVDGLITQNTPVPVATTSITVNFPPAGLAQTIGPDGPVIPLAPGSYASLDVRPRGKVALRTGTYYFDSFNSEPQGEIQLNGAPIYIYVKTSFTYKGAFKRISGADAQVLVGYLGTGIPLLQAPFVGTIAAPNGSLELRRPDTGQHRGSFFGKSIQTFSDANVAFVPFNYAFVCPLGDKDADGTFDCDDECPRDPAKTTPGQCGCGVSDVDTDGDKVANCEDECPLDAAVQVKGTCGCPSAPAPNGTACGDGICRGSKVCQAGVCGDPNACRPANGCVPKFFDSKWYWFCPGPTSFAQAKAACGTVKLALAQVDSDAENAFLAGAVSGNSYIGANDRGTSGQWRWQTLLSDAGDRFWNGGSSGRRYYTRYSAWGAGSPSGPHCATLANNGTWTSVDCSSSAGFICEVPASQGDEFKEKEHDKACEILGIPCDTVTPADCTDNETDVFANMSEAALVASFKACDDACKDGKENTTECANACTGPATPPSDPNDRCDDYDLGDTRACALKELVPSFGKPCETDAQCTDQDTVCGFYFGDCPLSTREDKVGRCFARNANGDKGSGKVCGKPSDGCPKVGDSSFPPRCNTTQICNIDPANEQTVVDAKGAGSDLSNTPFDAATTFGDPVPEPSLEDPYPADNNPCNGTCPVTEAHPWCKLGLQEQPQDRPEVKPEKHGRSDGPAISFDFDPRLRFDHNVTLGAFGVPKIDLTAQAGFSAGVTFDIANGGHVSVVDVMAGLNATECGIDSSTTLLVFEENFLPVLLGENNGDFPLPLHLPDEAGRKKCRDAIAKFEDVANRAKKAYRDATTLLKQYQKVVGTASNADNLSKQLCNDLLAERPRGFPPGICGSESPEDTINRFVDYYERTVIGFAGQEAMKGLADLVAPLADSIPKIPAKFTLYDFGRKEEVTVAQVQFFIGPIPVNLEVLTTSDYGVSINGEAELHAGEVVANMFSLSKDSAAKPLAFVQAGGVPHAGVGLALFAGVGFSAGGLTAKIGVEAALQLGELWIPAYAGAGVGLGSELDHRKLSDDDDKVSSGAELLPSKRYSLDVRYSALLKTKMRNVLQGSINGALKVKFFWFSKTWRKTLLSFNGFCKGTQNDDIPACDLSLISLGGTVDIASGSLPWATVRPELPFPKLQKITTVAPQGNGTIDKQVVGEFFYDSLCTCIDNTKPEEDRECFRNKDCCDATPKCFKGPSGGKATCIDCRKRDQDCNTVDECCGGAAAGLCWKNNCEPKHGCNQDCNTSADCRDGLGCNTSKKCSGSTCVE